MKSKKRGRANTPVDPMSISDEEGLRLGKILRSTVRGQIRKEDPPEVGATHRRLLLEGYSEAEAIELITAVLAVEMYHIMNEGREFDGAKYAAYLKRLPELPYDSDA